MAKNPRESEEERRASDGGICVVDVSPILIEGEEKGDGQGPGRDVPGFDIFLVKVNMTVIDVLSVGSEVTVKREGREFAVYSKVHRIGYVAPKDRKRVTAAITSGSMAWIRDIYDKGLTIRVQG